MHNRARQVFIDLAGITQPDPARFERNPGAIRWSAPARATSLGDVLHEWSAVA